MGKRSLENRISELEADAEEADDFEIVIRHTVVRTPWSDGRDDPPEPGTTATRYYYDETGEWQSEEIEDPDDPSEADR